MIPIDNLRFLSLCLALSCFARPVWHFGKRSWTDYRAASCWTEAKSQVRDEELADGEPVLWLRVDAIGLDSIVLHGDGEENLSRSPVLHRDTGRLTLVSAHRDTHFRNLGHLKVGDGIIIEDLRGNIRRYRIYDAEVCDPAEAVVRIREHKEANALVLMTCYPFRWIGPAPQRFLVWAERDPTSLCM